MRQLFTLSIGILFVVGCATTKAVKETAAFTGDFAKYKSVHVQLERNDKIAKEYWQEKLPTILSTYRH